MAKSPRNLAWKDTFVWYLLQEVSDRFDSLTTFEPLPFTDTETGIPVSFLMSGEQYTRIMSALSIGADLVYPDIAHELQLIMSQLIEVSMSCDDVADCIESSEAVQSAILQQLAANGIDSSGNPSAPINTLTAAATAANLLPAGYTCSESQCMATARAIVNSIHDGFVEFIGEIEFITNPAEFMTELADNVEIVSWFATASEAVLWFQENLIEFYEAAWNQDTEDTLACSIFCAFIDDCDLSLDDILSAYESNMGAIELPADITDPQQVVDWLLDLNGAADLAFVSACHWLITDALRFSRPVLDFLGIRTFEETILASQGQADNSWELCDTCSDPTTPNSFWYMDLDFNISKFGTITNPSVSAQAVWTGDGWETRTSNSQARAFIGKAFGSTALWLAGIRITSQRRGSEGNGTNDYKRMLIYPNENWTGTETLAWNHNFITGNTNDVVHEKLDFLDNVYSFKSSYFVESVNGAYAALTNFAKVYRVEIWGFNHSDYKPEGSIWVSSRV